MKKSLVFNVFAISADDKSLKPVKFCSIFKDENLFVALNNELIKDIGNVVGNLTGMVPILVANQGISFNDAAFGVSVKGELEEEVTFLTFDNKKNNKLVKNLSPEFFVQTNFDLTPETFIIKGKNFAEFIHIEADTNAIVSVGQEKADELNKEIENSNDKTIIDKIFKNPGSLTLNVNRIVGIKANKLSNGMIPDISLNSVGKISVNYVEEGIPSGINFKFEAENKSTSTLPIVLNSFTKVYKKIFDALKVKINVPENLGLDVSLSTDSLVFLFDLGKENFECAYSIKKKQSHCNIGEKLFVLVEETEKYIAYEVKSFADNLINKIAEIFKKKLNDDVELASYHMDNIAHSSYAIENINDN